ncbi:MAG: V-type ATP synthase subunit D [Bacteroidales bacterium]|nr:V-type ATP synthase subunit D [Bacteroidales bacterium]
MAIKFQYNKTSLQQLEKSLKVRVKALPTIKNKESALRLEVKKAKNEAKRLDQEFERMIRENEEIMVLYGEYNADLLEVVDVKVSAKKIAGVPTPVFEGVEFNIKPYSLFNNPAWLPEGIEMVRQIASIGLEREIFVRKTELLEYARKKTTQKVNLFEKVHIPGYQDAIRKIKRFMEDEENLSKAAQKIVKARQETKEDAA